MPKAGVLRHVGAGRRSAGRSALIIGTMSGVLLTTGCGTGDDPAASTPETGKHPPTVADTPAAPVAGPSDATATGGDLDLDFATASRRYSEILVEIRRDPAVADAVAAYRQARTGQTGLEKEALAADAGYQEAMARFRQASSRGDARSEALRRAVAVERTRVLTGNAAWREAAAAADRAHDEMRQAEEAVIRDDPVKRRIAERCEELRRRILQRDAGNGGGEEGRKEQVPEGLGRSP